MATPPKAILVTGDFVLDLHIYEGRRYHFADGMSSGVRVIPQAGGAVLVHELLRALLPPEKATEKPTEKAIAAAPTLTPAESTSPEWRSELAVNVPKFEDVAESQRAYAFWRPFPQEAATNKQYWRVSEAMGFGSDSRSAACRTWEQSEHSVTPDVIVLSEGGMGFRQTDCCWEDLPFKESKWIVLKTTAPIAQGNLWNKLTSEFATKLIVIVAATELRKTTARLSAGLSWDETLESLLNEFQPRHALSALTNCRHLIVSFGSEGALWLDMRCHDGDSKSLKTRPAHFVYDPPAVEGEHAHALEGTAFGFLSCLTAAVAWQIVQNPVDPDLETACEGGLCAMRDLREKGHGPITAEASGFPTKRLAKAIQKPEWRYSRARFAAPVSGKLATGWNLLRESIDQSGPAFDLARLTALRGPIALDNVPSLKIGRLLAVDRHEVESLRTLVQLMRRYAKHDPGKKPLSIGVFGPPGSGKSFAVQQIATQLSGADGWMEFNLSQFSSAEDLIGAFHQIRDKVLQKTSPVVFFDEFDSQKYHWLQYLLAPMQDGRFQEGQVTHPIGKCIFVFAGGTCATFETFGPPPISESKSDTRSCSGPTRKETEAQIEFRLSKGPDFKSRLDAYLNVVGPNQRQVAQVKAGRYVFSADESDIFFPIRRALMLRTELKCLPEAKLEFDEGVLNALLQVEEFQHGSRSLAKLLQPFQPHSTGSLVRSLLPPTSQIAMHTDATEFLQLCNDAPPRSLTPATMSGSAELSATDALNESEIAVLAPAIHDKYQALGVKAGWLEKGKESAFEKLDEFDQQSNRAAARRMIRILDLLGLRLEPGENSPDERHALSRLFEFHLELLAEAEHEGWMQWHFEQGWRNAPLPDGKTKDKGNKVHTCLIPFNQLKQVDQEKDRQSIRAYLDFAKLANKKIVSG